jgi:hypothetical protein
MDKNQNGPRNFEMNWWTTGFSDEKLEMEWTYN